MKTMLARLHQILYFDMDSTVDIEIGETIESTAAILTRFKLITQNETFNLIYKDFRAEWIGGGGAELAWYNKFAPSINPGISPKFYGGEIDRQPPHCYLFLEDISETHKKVPDTWPETAVHLNTLTHIVNTLLQLHIPWWNHADLKSNTLMHPQGGPLRLAHATTPATINSYVQALHRAFPDIIKSMNPTLAASWVSICEQAVQSWEVLLTSRIREDKNLTMLHGDFHIWNVFFPRQPRQDRLLLVDWETYKRGIGVYDLAYLLITGLDVPTRRQHEQTLLRQYHTGLLAAGISQYSWQDCVQDYRLAIIANLFPPLMWRKTENVKRAITAFEDWNCAELLI